MKGPSSQGRSLIMEQRFKSTLTTKIGWVLERLLAEAEDKYWRRCLLKETATGLHGFDSTNRRSAERGRRTQS